MSFEAGARPTPVAKRALNQGSAYLRGTDAVKIEKETTPGIMRWPRVASMAYGPYAIAATREDCSLPLSGV